MGAFEYTALDNGGREKKGILEGDTARQVRQLLREKQLLPVTVTEVAEKESTEQKKSFLAPHGASPLPTCPCSRVSSPRSSRRVCRSKNPCLPSPSRRKSPACRASSWAYARA